MADEMRLWDTWFRPQLPYGIFLLALWMLSLSIDPESVDLVVFLPFLGSILVFGLPHGALDDRVYFKQRRRGSKDFATPVAFYSFYLGLIAAYLSVWYFFPVLAFLLFLFITWFHWGQGDLYTLRAVYQAHHVQSLFCGAVVILLRGSLPIFLTFLCYSEIYVQVANWSIALFADDPPGFPPSLFLMLPTLFLLYTGGIALYLVLTFLSAPSTRKKAWMLDAGEILILFLLFSTLHPLISIGLYFCLWHSLRHLARLEGWISSDSPPSRLVFPWFPKKAMGKAFPNTALSLIGLFLIAILGHQQSLGLQMFTGIYLVLIAVLTLPHLWVVAWMDSFEWKRKAAHK